MFCRKWDEPEMLDFWIYSSFLRKSSTEVDFPVFNKTIFYFIYFFCVYVCVCLGTDFSRDR